jgi:hypothetical protein
LLQPLGDTRKGKGTRKEVAMRQYEENSDIDRESLSYWQELRSLTKDEEWCCKVFKEVGIDWMQCETINNLFHRIKLLFCPHCGKKL